MRVNIQSTQKVKAKVHTHHRFRSQPKHLVKRVNRKRKAKGITMTMFHISYLLSLGVRKARMVVKHHKKKEVVADEILYNS